MLRNRRPSWQEVVALLVSLLGPVSLQAAPQAGGPPPIDVQLIPSKTLPGGHVTLRGSAVPVGPGSKVSIVVQPPGGGKPIALDAPIDGGGSYSVVFTQTVNLGSYAVQVTAPDGKGKASATLSVVAAGVIPSAVADATGTLLELSLDAVKSVRQALGVLPPSPARQEAQTQLVEAEKASAQAIAQVPVIREEMTKAFQARASVEEDNAEWDNFVGELEKWQVDAGQRAAELKNAIKGISAGTERCGTLDRMAEALTFVSEASNYANAPLDLGKGYLIDKVPGAFVERLSASSDYKPATKFVAIAALKTTANVLTGGPAAAILAIPGLVAGAGQLLLQDELGGTCERLEGPITATFLGESFTKQGEPFFDYTTTLDGKMVLMYEKAAPTSQPIGLVGYIEGSGRFTVRDNPDPVVRLTPGQVLFHSVKSPAGAGYWGEVGQFSRALLPHSFRIPLKGVLAGDSIVLTLQAAAHDFGDVIEGRSTYVVLPLGGLVPQIIDSPIALQKAHPIIERVVRRHPVLKVTRGAKDVVVQGSFARDTTNAANTARVRTQLTLKACSPACLPLPNTPSGKKPGGGPEERP